MSVPRLKTAIRVNAALRRCAAAGAFATVARRGDADAGTIAVKVYPGGREAFLYVEARKDDGALYWRNVFDGPVPEAKIDDYLAKEARIDPDMWMVEIEDREGRNFFAL